MRKSFFIIIGLLAFLGIAVVVHRLTPVPPPPPLAPPQEQRPEESLFRDPIPPAEDIITRGFQSGGLGLSRSAWEVLRGKPQPAGGWFLYQGHTYAVSYQQDIVWQLKCTWKRPGFDLVQVRAWEHEIFLMRQAGVDPVFVPPCAVPQRGCVVSLARFFRAFPDTK